MGAFSVLEISIAGMDTQQARLSAAAANLANANTVHPDGRAYTPIEVEIGSAIDAGSGLPRPLAVPSSGTLPPGTPQGSQVAAIVDEQESVEQTQFDAVGAMLALMQISRTYEANVRTFDVSRALLTKTIELWGAR